MVAQCSTTDAIAPAQNASFGHAAGPRIVQNQLLRWGVLHRKVANFKKDPYYTCDLAAMGSETVQQLAGGRVDFLLGCPPCQGFSDVGTRKARDKRNSHLANFARLAVELKPLAIGMENVPLVSRTSGS